MDDIINPIKKAVSSVKKAVSSIPVIGKPLVGIGQAAFGVIAPFADVLTLGMLGLTPKPKSADFGLNFASFGSFASSKLVSIKQAIMTRQIIYGTRRIAGSLLYAETTGTKNKYLHLIYGVAGHEINSFVSFKINDDDVTLDGDGFVNEDKYKNGSNKLVRIKTHTGADGQSADSDLVSESDSLWTSEHKLDGIAYYYVRLEFNETAFPNGIPNFTTIVQGKKVFDPRTSTTAFSSNPALCVRDYLTNSRYGLGAKATEINDTSFNSAANTCDEDVALDGGGTENRYECHGILDTGFTPAKVLTQLTSSCVGFVYYSGGKWSIKAGEYLTPTVTLDEDDLVGPINVSTRNSRRDSFNAIKGIFSDPNENYQPVDFPAIESSAFETEDNSEQIFRDIELPFTTSSSMAQRIAKILLFRNREQMTITVSVKLTGFNVEIGDTIQITNSRFGFSSKTFEVLNWSLESGANGVMICNMILKEIQSSVFDWNAEEQAIISNNTTLPNVFDVSAPGLSVSDVLRAFNQEAVTVLIVDVTTSDSFVTDFEVEAKQTTDSEYISLGKSSTNRYELVNVEDGVTYDVRARAVTTLGSKSPYTETVHQVVGKTAPPSNVTNFSVNVIDDVAHLSWTPVTDLDLSHYKIRHTTERTSPRYVAAQTVVEKVARPAQSVAVPAMTGTYFCKAVDKLGNLSETPASTQVLIGDTIFNQVNTVETVTENPSFSGAVNGVVATTDNTLILDTSINFDSATGNFDDATGNFDGGGGNVNASGTYDFASKTDLGAKFKTRVNYTLTVDRVEYVTSFDDASGNFDDREGPFDGDVNAFDTTDVVMQIATTDDDPNGASPTFTDFRDFIAGEYEARGFKYRIVLKTSDSQASPTVSALAVKVEMVDRRLAEGDISSGTSASGKVVSFSQAFKSLESLQVTGQNLNSGDTYAITSKSASGFTIKFTDSGSSVVDRTFDYVATGYGAQST